MPFWYSIEVFDGSSSASLWAEAYGDTLIESALSSGAVDWSWHRHAWGVVLEVSFEDEAAWEAFRLLTPVRASLDAVPDPVTGLIVYPGRGGSASSGVPRRPRPRIGSGSASLPLPWELGSDDVFPQWPVAPVIRQPTVTLPALAGFSARQR
ncbi:MAG TPA: hypothetical protein VG184_09285 [Acidimicrobiales bacterium]|nr:hypothetical protein [Acidimicrobiales bacterium]